MKRNIIGLLLAGCITAVAITGCSSSETEEDTTQTVASSEPVYYTSEEELPEDAYYIVRTEKVTNKTITGKKETKKETRYYPLLQAENTLEDVVEEPTGYVPERIEWVNSDVDESAIPTMYVGDQMIYKSATQVPTIFTLEKFFDNGYTIGVMGLQQDLSGNYKFDPEVSHTMSTSDATGFAALEDVESIYLAQVGDNRLSPVNVSLSGTVSGLEKNKKYKCDIRRGTEKIDATLTANIHYFSSAETYLFGSFNFTSPYIAQLNIPNYVTTGYYNLNSAGFFRYVNEEDVKDWTKLKDADFNDTIYTYNEDGAIDGTSIGYIFDDNGFLIPGTLEDESAQKSYEDTTEEDVKESKEVTNKTKLKAESGGLYSGSYIFESISDPKTVIKDGLTKTVYTIKAKNTENEETIDLKYEKDVTDNEIETGQTYLVTFEESTDGFDGYNLVTVKSSGATDQAVETEKQEQENVVTEDPNGTDTETITETNTVTE